MTVACWLGQANSAVLFSDKGRAWHFALKGALVRWPRTVACQLAHLWQFCAVELAAEMLSRLLQAKPLARATTVLTRQPQVAAARATGSRGVITGQVGSYEVFDHSFDAVVIGAGGAGLRAAADLVALGCRRLASPGRSQHGPSHWPHKVAAW